LDAPEEKYVSRANRIDEWSERLRAQSGGQGDSKVTSSKGKYYGEKKLHSTKKAEVAANPLVSYMKEMLGPGPINGIPNDLVCFGE
jgi:hypothetical protein